MGMEWRVVVVERSLEVIGEWKRSFERIEVMKNLEKSLGGIDGLKRDEMGGFL